MSTYFAFKRLYFLIVHHSEIFNSSVYQELHKLYSYWHIRSEVSGYLNTYYALFYIHNVLFVNLLTYMREKLEIPMDLFYYKTALIFVFSIFQIIGGDLTGKVQ